MKQIIILVILAGAAFAAWKYLPGFLNKEKPAQNAQAPENQPKAPEPKPAAEPGVENPEPASDPAAPLPETSLPDAPGAPAASNEKQFKVDIDLGFERRRAGLVAFTGTSNLPPGFKINLKVEDTMGQEVSADFEILPGGKFETDAIQMPPGEYTMYLAAPPLDSQPANVQSVIGPGGKFLAGPLVQELGDAKELHGMAKFTVTKTGAVGKRTRIPFVAVEN